MFQTKRFAIALSVLAVLGLGVLLSACGSSSSSSSESSSSGAEESTTATGESTTAAAEESGSESSTGGLAAAEKAVEEQSGEFTAFVPPGPPIKTASLKGQAIWYVPLSAQIPVMAIEANGIKEATSVLGMEYKTCDGKFVPANASTCITQAINSSAAAIVLDSIEPSSIGPALKAAEAAGVPVYDFSTAGEETELLTFLDTGDPSSQRAAMNWIAVNSEGTGNILAVVGKGNLGTDEATKAGVTELEANCPECQYTAVELTGPQTANVSTLSSATSSALLKNPEADYGFPEYDFFAPGFQAGIQQAGRTSSVALVSTNAELGRMQEVASGQQAADIGVNRNYLGWQAVDMIARQLLKEPKPTKYTLPLRIFDESNIGEIELTEGAAMSGEWFGPTKYKQEFPELWGAG